MIIDLKTLTQIIKKNVANGSQPGPTGMTGEMLKVFIDDDGCKYGIHCIVTAIANGWFGEDDRVRSLVLASRLVLLPKYAADGKTKRGLRPIAMGESIWKAAVSYAKEKVPTLFKEIQFGVQFDGGCDVAVIGAQAALDEDDDNIAVMFDITNAFNTRSRADIAESLYSRPETKPLWKLFDFAYAGSPTPLMVYGEKGQLKLVQPSAQGVRQGDPLAALLFALSMQSIYEGTRTAGREGGKSVKCFAILDDFTIVGRPEAVVKAMDHFIKECDRVGLKINAQKTAILCPQLDDRYRSSVKNRIVRFNAGFKEMSGMDFTVSEQRFAPLLGSVIGRDEEGMSEWTVERVKKHEKFFTLLPKLRAQIGTLLLRWSGVPRVVNLMRTIPPRICKTALELFDRMVEDSFFKINGIARGEFDKFMTERSKLTVKQGGDGLRRMTDLAKVAYASAVARTAAAGLISPELIGQYYDGGGGGPPPDGGGGGHDIGGGDASDKRQRKRRRLNQSASHPSSSSHSSSSSSSALCAAASAMSARRTVVSTVMECIEAVHEAVADHPKSAAEVNDLLPKGRSFWSKFMPVNLSSYASTHSLHTSAASSSASSSSSSVSPIVSFAVVDPERAKAASKAAAQLQRKLTSAIEEAAFDRLIASAQSTTDAVRAVNCSLNGATLFNHIRPLERALELKDFAWRSAIRHKYGLPPVYASNRVAVCVCGQLIGTGHNHSCNRVLGPATTERHDMVVGCLEDMMREEFGFLPSEVRARVRNGDRSKFIIPDLVVTDERKGEQWAIDVTGLYGESDSYLPKQAVGELTADELCGRTMDVLRARDKRRCMV